MCSHDTVCTLNFHAPPPSAAGAGTAAASPACVGGGGCTVLATGVADGTASFCCGFSAGAEVLTKAVVGCSKDRTGLAAFSSSPEAWAAFTLGSSATGAAAVSAGMEARGGSVSAPGPLDAASCVVVAAGGGSGGRLYAVAEGTGAAISFAYAAPLSASSYIKSSL